MILSTNILPMVVPDSGDAVVDVADEGKRSESGTLLASCPVLADSPTRTIVPLSNLPPSQPKEKKKLDHHLEFADTSAPLFVMYHRMTKEEDNQLAERWQKDAKGIIIFVSSLITFYTTFCTPLQV